MILEGFGVDFSPICSWIFNDFEQQYNDCHRCSSILNDSTAFFIDFSKTFQTSTVLFYFSNHAKVQVPIFTV